MGGSHQSASRKVGGTCVVQNALLQAGGGLQRDAVQVAGLSAAQERLVHARAAERNVTWGALSAVRHHAGKLPGAESSQAG